MMTIFMLHRHPKQYFHESRLTRYLQYFRNVGPSYIVTKPTSGLRDSTLGFRGAFGENSKLGGGNHSFSGDDHDSDTVSRTPRTISARTHHAVLQKQTIGPGMWDVGRRTGDAEAGGRTRDDPL